MQAQYGDSYLWAAGEGIERFKQGKALCDDQYLNRAINPSSDFCARTWLLRPWQLKGYAVTCDQQCLMFLSPVPTKSPSYRLRILSMWWLGERGINLGINPVT
ncbi:hypothetical protein TNCV_2436111 [Trichonephila clavipes]|nr:hypothetical protein TNCV_2436111 [Trichonephila clavipes]